MKRLRPDRPHLPDGLAGAQPSSSPSSPPRRVAFSHRQARGRLALALDPTTEPELLERLQQHVAVCARCRQELEELRQAEAWFRAQPAEVPQMVAVQDAVWVAIQARMRKNGAALAASNGHRHDSYALASGVAEASEQPARSEPESLPATPAAVPQEQLTRVAVPPEPSAAAPPESPPAPVPLLPASKVGIGTPMKALIALLAASFLMSSLALLVVHFSGNPPSSAELNSASAPSVTDILDPGNVTLALAFDPLSRQLFTLTSDDRFDCPRGWFCPAQSDPPCLRMSSLEADTGRLSWSLLPACMSTVGKSGATFTALLDDTALGLVALVDSAGQVTTLNTRTHSTSTRYHLACCAAPQTRPAKTLLDVRDHLLLTTSVHASDGTLQSLAAQDVATGQIRYQMPLDSKQLQGVVWSAVTGWLYLWTACAAESSTSCVEVYSASNGKRVGGWKAPAHSTPLEADPGAAVLYARAESPAGREETLALDGQTGVVVGQLPPARAIAVNSRLRHAYLLDEDGVTLVDTRTRHTLSTLPVLAHDGVRWAAPVVDERAARVYLPTTRGKVLLASDDAAGHLRLGSPALQATLDAERAMAEAWEAGTLDLDPVDLPVGLGTFTFYYPLEQKQPSGCSAQPVPARTESAAAPLSGGDYTVTISLAWADATTHAATTFPVTSPPAQTSYPHWHAWKYHIPASGGAKWSGEQGEALPRCQGDGAHPAG